MLGSLPCFPPEKIAAGGFVHNCNVLPDSCEAIVALSGKAAVEMQYPGQLAEGCGRDIKRAVNCIREAAANVGKMGFSLLDVESDHSASMSESLNARSEAAVQAELERCYNKAEKHSLSERTVS